MLWLRLRTTLKLLPVTKEDEILKKLERIERVLIGDEDFKRKGVVHDLQDVVCYIEKEKLNAAKRKGWLLGAAAAVGAGSGAAMDWLKKVVF
jgi:hypothetical protein